MSDYPRPEVPAPVRPFLPDRIVGAVGMLYFAGSALWGLAASLLRREARTFFLNNPYYLPLYLSLLLVFLWGFLLVYKGRRGGFLGATILLSFTLLGAFFTGRMTSSIPYFVVWAYCVARLFGLLVPKPTKV